MGPFRPADVPTRYTGPLKRVSAGANRVDALPSESPNAVDGENCPRFRVSPTACASNTMDCPGVETPGFLRRTDVTSRVESKLAITEGRSTIRSIRSGRPSSNLTSIRRVPFAAVAVIIAVEVSVGALSSVTATRFESAGTTISPVAFGNVPIEVRNVTKRCSRGSAESTTAAIRTRDPPSAGATESERVSPITPGDGFCSGAAGKSDFRHPERALAAHAASVQTLEGLRVPQ